MSNLSYAHIVGANSGTRSKSDFYPTPPDCTEALLRFLLPQNNCTIWEPACGNGAISKVLKKHGYKVLSSDIQDYGYEGALTGEDYDFLSFKYDDVKIDYIITNPPFSLSEEFAFRAYELKIPFAFLLKAQYWNAAKRKSLFRKMPPHYILPLTWRPDFTGRGSSLMDMNWCIWDVGFCGRTEYVPLDRPMERSDDNGDTNKIAH